MRLRTRITLVVLLVTTLVSVLVGAYAVISVRNSQTSLLDQNLDQIVASTAGSSSEAISSALFTVQQDDLDAVVDFVDGHTISRLSLTTFAVPRLPPARALRAARYAAQASPLGGGIRFRTVALAGGGYLFVAVSSSNVARSVHSLLLRLVLFTVIADLIAGGLMWLYVKRDTRKIDELITLANDISDHQSNVSLPASSGRSDVDQLSSSLGRMMESLNQAVALERSTTLRMQQFLGDASHELRTPLTVIRGYSELLLDEAARPPEVQERALRRMNDEVQRMDQLLSDLLLLTELGESRHHTTEIIDLSELVSAHVEDFRALEPDRKVDEHIEAGITFRGTASYVERLLNNILSNVRRHTPADAAVLVSLVREADVARLRIDDAGPGLPAEAYERGPQGFTRYDQSRSRTSGGSGLGLSIISAIVAECQGSVVFEPAALGGLSVQIGLPVHTD